MLGTGGWLKGTLGKKVVVKQRVPGESVDGVHMTTGCY